MLEFHPSIFRVVQTKSCSEVLATNYHLTWCNISEDFISKSLKASN